MDHTETACTLLLHDNRQTIVDDTEPVSTFYDIFFVYIFVRVSSLGQKPIGHFKIFF